MTNLDPDILYAALLARDPAYDGQAFVGVTSTGIFCRLTCPARKPLQRNSQFYPTIAACRAAGFRPCKRCQPEAPLGPSEPTIDALLSIAADRPDETWSEARLAEMGFDPSTVRRAFQRRYGMSFLALIRLRKLGHAAEQLSLDTPVIAAQLDAGYSSASGFRDAFTKVTGNPPAKLRGHAVLVACLIETPIGPMMAVADDHHIRLLEFLERKALKAELLRLQKTSHCAIAFGQNSVLEQIKDELSAYFSGSNLTFKTRPFQHGSAFAQTVWRALQDIPAGSTQSYGTLAQTVGRPTASRAVAGANGANTLAILIPCHRIIGADGSLTGYGGGLWRKRWLLTHETKFRSIP